MGKRADLLLAAVVAGTLAAGAAHGAEPLGAVEAVACAPSDPETGAAVVDGSVWTTRDGGLAWSLAARLPPAEVESGVADEEIEPASDPWADAGADEISATASLAEAAVVALAVADDGSFAALRGGVIHRGGPGPGISARLRVAAAVGLAFVRDGSLFVATRRFLIRFGSGARDVAAAEQWPMTGLAAVARGRRTDEILAAGPDGLYAATWDDRIFRYRVTKLSDRSFFAAASGSDGALVAVRSDRLVAIRGASESDLGRAPEGAVELAVGKGAIRARTASGVWHEHVDGYWRPLAARAMAVDRAGRFWEGDDLRPSGPAAARRALRIVDAPPSGAGPDRAATCLAPHAPEPPPCRRFPFDPLPAVRASVDWRRLGAAHRAQEPTNDTGAAAAELFFGLRLTWSLDPPEPWACRARERAWRDDALERRRRAAALGAAARGARRFETVGASLAQTIDARLERERLDALVALTCE